MARSALGVDPLERLPRLNEVTDGREWPVDQEQVDALQAQVRQGLIEPGERPVEAELVVVELARHEDVGRIEARTFDGDADLLLVLVHLRRIDVSIADLERSCHCLDRLFGLHLEYPESQLRDLDAIVELDRGHGHEVAHLLVPEPADYRLTLSADARKTRRRHDKTGT